MPDGFGGGGAAFASCCGRSCRYGDGPAAFGFFYGDRVCGGGGGVADTLSAFSQAGGERAAVGTGGWRLALRFGGAGRIPAAYFATAAFILAVSMVETSYLLAYHDELTTLPSRRAFHEALLRLQAPYSIAMVDIDHFKRCNDTYGHDTGDQVLRMVASRLARVTGGGQAYRCGGEEFAIVFPGKTTKDVLEHLEQLRASIEASSFRLRGNDKDRRQEARGRTGAVNVGRRQAGHAIRQLARVRLWTELSVTASIGVATSGSERFVSG